MMFNNFLFIFVTFFHQIHKLSILPFPPSSFMEPAEYMIIPVSKEFFHLFTTIKCSFYSITIFPSLYIVINLLTVSLFFMSFFQSSSVQPHMSHGSSLRNPKREHASQLIFVRILKSIFTFYLLSQPNYRFCCL